MYIILYLFVVGLIHNFYTSRYLSHNKVKFSHETAVYKPADLDKYYGFKISNDDFLVSFGSGFLPGC